MQLQWVLQRNTEILHAVYGFSTLDTAMQWFLSTWHLQNEGECCVTAIKSWNINSAKSNYA